MSHDPSDICFLFLYFIKHISQLNYAAMTQMFLEHQMLELFLKDHVTLKTGVMAAENSALVKL